MSALGQERGDLRKQKDRLSAVFPKSSPTSLID